jgi:aryl-alcohol dehydrogenase-like predicted oxidoreductase
MTLPTRPFGSTGAEVTMLGFGAMELRGAPRSPALTDDDAGLLLHAVLDAGITLIDTSPDYGRSEELIGTYLAGRREEYFLASKAGCPIGDEGVGGERAPHDWSRANLRAGVEQSLRRLRTDRLDLVQLHHSPSREVMEREGSIEELLALRNEGKIRFLGISGVLPELPEQLAMGCFDAFQIPYSALQREHEELIATAASQGAATVIRGGVARGAADGGARSGATADKIRERWSPETIEDLLDGTSPMAFMLRFTLSHPGLNTTIVGTSNRQHLVANVATASEGPLPADLYDEAKRRFAVA